MNKDEGTSLHIKTTNTRKRCEICDIATMSQTTWFVHVIHDKKSFGFVFSANRKSFLCTKETQNKF